jgi:hypothetical protein
VTAGRALVFFSCLAGCSAPNHLEGSLYQNGSVSFRVPPVPDGWARIEVSDANLAFRDDAREASILVDGRCNRRDEDAPLTALTEHLIIGTTAREFVSEDVVAFDSREAQHTVMRAKLDGVTMQYDIYVLKKDGCVYDFVYVAPPDRFADGAPRFEQFATGFHTVGAGGL